MRDLIYWKISKIYISIGKSSSSTTGSYQLLAILQLRRVFLENFSSSKFKMIIKNYLANINTYKYSTTKVTTIDQLPRFEAHKKVTRQSSTANINSNSIKKV